MIMNKRTREILVWLMKKNKYHETCTIDDLMQNFSVSQRTIRYDLEEVAAFLEENNVAPLTIMNGGTIQVSLDQGKLREILKDSDFYAFKLSSEERVEMISYLLLSTHETLTLQQLADILYVSRSTIIHDVEKVRGVVRSMHLLVVSLRKGLIVEGKESNKRIALLQLLRKEYIHNYRLHESGVQMFSVQDEAMLTKIIEDVERMSKRFITDGSFNDLKEYVMLMIDHIQTGCYLEIDYIAQHIGMQKMASNLVHHIENYFGVKCSLQEEYLLGDILYNLDYLKRNDIDDRIMQIQVVSKQFIDAIAKDLQVNLQDDFQFYQNLTNHLQSTFKDMPMMTLQDNELLREVVKKNPDIVHAVQRHIAPLEEFVQRRITKDEIAYITIHVCAAMERHHYQGAQFMVLIVCNSGVGTSQLLLSRLKKYFSLFVVDVLPVHMLPNYDVACVDLIIATVPIQETRCASIILHPYLNDEDCIMLGKKLAHMNMHKKTVDSSPQFRRIQTTIANAMQHAPLDKDEIYKSIMQALRSMYLPEASVSQATLSTLLKGHIQTDVACTSWEDAVRKSAQPLLEEGCICDRYITQMIRNIQQMGPYIVLAPGFALPHASPEMGGCQLGMNLIRLKQPVFFHTTQFDPVCFVCCLSTIDKESHLKAMFHLMNLLAKPDFCKNIDAAKNPEELYQIVSEYESLM